MLSVLVSLLASLVMASDAIGPATSSASARVEGVVAPKPASWDASAYEWRTVPIGGGGFITGLSMDRRGVTRLGRADVFGAYLWDAAADRWIQLVTTASMPEAEPMRLNKGVYEVVVAPSDPDRIYMAIAGALYRSMDRGRRFEKMALPPLSFNANSPFRFYGPFIAVKPDNPDVVLLGTPRDGTWRSIDGGVNWSRVAGLPSAAANQGSEVPGAVLWFSPDGWTVFASVFGQGVWRSDDDGRSFHLEGRQESARPKQLIHGAFASGGVFFGVDGEERKVWKLDDGRWTDLTNRTGLRPERFAAVAVNPRNDGVYVFDVGGRGFYSADGGDSWKRISGRPGPGENEPPWLHVVDLGYFATGAVTFDPVRPNRLWNAAGTGPYVADLGSDPLRIDWKSQVRGIEELVANDVVAAPGQSPIFASWDFGLHVRNDLTRFSTGYGPKERVLIAVQQVDWSASDPRFMVTNASDTRTNCCSEDGDAILAGYSTDAGRTWTKFASLPQPPGTEASDPWRMSFGTIAVSSSDVNNIVWAPANNRAPFYTTDRGVSWKRVELPGEVLPNTGSYDRYNYHRRTVTADRVKPATFYLMHSGEGRNGALEGLWSTEDGGRTWRRVFAGAIAPDSRFSAKLRAVPGHAGHLFFTANAAHSADKRLRRSTDGGRTWVALDEVEHAHDVAFGKAAPGRDYPAIYLTGRVKGVYGIWRSVDNAASWVRVGAFPLGVLDEVVAMDADKDVFGRVYLGFQGSGWRYGQPANCQPHAPGFGTDLECYGLNAPF